MKKKSNNPPKEKLVLNLFRYDIAKKMKLNQICLFLLRELLRWWASCSYNVEDKAYYSKMGFKSFYLSIKKKYQDWGFVSERALSTSLMKLELIGIIARSAFQFKRGDDKRKTTKYLGKKLYLVPIARTLRELCALDLPENKAIKDFVISLEKLEPDYEKLDNYQKQLKEKELVQVETINRNENKRYSGIKKEVIEKAEKQLRDKLNNKDSIQVKISKPKTEGEKKMDIQEILKKDFKDLTDAEKILLMDTPLPDEEKEINGMEYSNIYDDPNYGIPECYRD